MNQEITFLTLFLLGFFGGTHCVGMCGGLSSAFALQLPPHLNRIGLIVLLNLGRISSYVVIGLLVGLVGQVGISLDDTRAVQNGLYIAANVLLLLLGLYLAGISTAATKIEGIGKPIWKRLNPLLNKLLPIKSVPACFGVGVLWAGCLAVWCTARLCMLWAAAMPCTAGCICWRLHWDIAEPACDGHICSAVENLSAKTHGSFVRRIISGRMAIWRLAVFTMGQIG